MFQPVPQVLKNVRLAHRDAAKAVMESKTVIDAIEAAEARLGAAGGRLLIRKSGTEPKMRVMAEGDDKALVEELVDTLCEVIQGEAAREVV